MRLRSIELKNIHIEDAFWSKHVDLVRKTIIPYQWETMNDRIPDAQSSHCLENFRIAAKEAQGEFYGAVFQDTDVAKWLEAVGFSLACYPDKELEQTADEAIDLITRAQCSDGYINTYFTIREPDRRWKDLGAGHELYTAGHLMEASVAYYQGTGKRKFLDCMCRFADLICDTFGTEKGKIYGYPGHQEVEIGLIKLWQVTGEQRYLDQAKYFIDARGVGENYFLKEMSRPDHHLIFPEFADYDPRYSQSHLPVREQTAAEGHAVRAVYMYCAMADLAEAYGDTSLMRACERLWKNMVEKRMYVTGGIGSSGILERFTTDYDLPNDYNYSESCASIGLALFGLRMSQITRDAGYMDIVERALYNTVLAGIALDGKSFFYVNPLEVWPPACMDRTSKEHVKPVRQKWFGVACCPPNIARTLASLGQYLYSVSEDALWVNLFASSEAETRVGAQKVRLVQKTEFPRDGHIRFAVSCEKPGMKLAVRIPEYAKDCRLDRAPERIEKGYAYFTVSEGEWNLDMRFEMLVRVLRANPQVRADSGKAALQRGPLVYCLEEIDNGPNLPALFLKSGEEIRERFEPGLFGGTTVLTAQGMRISEKDWKEGELYRERTMNFESTELTFVPYPYWGNRGMGEMLVWVKEWICGK